MIKLKNVSKYYNNDGVVTLGLRNVNLDLKKNEIVAIVGDSGSGKSTLLNVICGVDSYDDGEMYFKGNETSYFNQNDLDIYRKKHVGFIFQNYNIIDSYTVLENVKLPMILNGLDEKEATLKALELIDKVGLTERKYNRGVALSGGEKQRCVIARALASDCDILACDEPTGNLDSKTGEEIIKLIKEVSQDKLVLIVTHNYDEVKDIITRRIKISDGEVTENYEIKSVEDDLDEGVSFVDETQTIKPLLKVVEKNVKATPKKTLLTFMVFLTISLIAFYLYLTCMASSQVSSFNPDGSFNLYEYNRLIAFNYDHSNVDNIDISDIDGTVYKNAFYEDVVFSIRIKNTKVGQTYLGACYSQHKLNYTHLQGSQLDEGYERGIYLILPYEELDKYSLLTLRYLDGTIIINEQKEFSFIGVGYSKEVKQVTLQSNIDISRNVISSCYSNLYKAMINVNGQTGELRRAYFNVKKPTLYLPYTFEESNVSYSVDLYLNELYKVDNVDYDVVYTGSNDAYKFALPGVFIPEFNHTYELTIYAEKPNQLIPSLERKGLTVIRPSVDYVDFTQNQLLFYAYLVISTLIIFALSFTSYIILSRIYVSKNKEYAVFRSLGILKNKMKFIVTCEVMFVGVLSSVVAFILLYVLYFTVENDYLNVVRYNNIYITLLYFAIMIFFSYFVSNRFNKRLFKNSVSQTFKDEVKND